MEPVNEASQLYEVERRVLHAERPGFRISELQIGPHQFVPWHLHTAISDTFYVLEGAITVSLRNPDETVRLHPGQVYSVPALRPHHVANASPGSSTFLVLQGMGSYDYVPLP